MTLRECLFHSAFKINDAIVTSLNIINTVFIIQRKNPVIYGVFYRIMYFWQKTQAKHHLFVLHGK